MQSGWQSWLLQAWQRRGALAWALWPVSLVYAALVAIRRRLYATGWMRSVRLPVPVIVVGNVVVGGTGKTPVVIALVQHLKDQGWQVGVISRGHGRATTDCREVHTDDHASDTGDESLLIRLKTNTPVFVARQRAHAALALLRAYPDTQVIVADDGLQHWALQRDLEVCVFDDRGAGNGFLLPAGLLREPWPQTPAQPLAPTQGVRRWVVHTGQNPRFFGFRCLRQLASHAMQKDGKLVELAAFQSVRYELHAIAGIAQPKLFFEQLRAQGLHLSQTQSLPDHYDFDSWKRRTDCQNEVFCTEKDAVKLWRKHPDVWAVPLLTTLEPQLLSEIDGELSRRLSSEPLPPD